MKKALPVIGLLFLMLLGAGLVARPDLVTLGVAGPSRAVIIRETAIDKPLTQAMVEVFAKAPSIGVAVWDKDVLGKGKQPSAEAKPFVDAAQGKELPVLTLQWAGGSVTAQPCPATFDALRKVVVK